MIKFILNNQTIETDLPKGLTVLDFVRYRKNLKGTKIGCREGDCGACTVMVGELVGDKIKYRTQTSCLMPIANANGKHIVTVEGINKTDGNLTPVQQALVDASGTQCGFCTVGFVMSLTNFCLDDADKNAEAAVSAIDGNICRCTGYKSIERAAVALLEAEKGNRGVGELNHFDKAIKSEIVPSYFSEIKSKLKDLQPKKSAILNPTSQIIAGGTDLYVQKHEEMVEADGENLFDLESLRFIREMDEFVEVGASTVVTDLLESSVFQHIFPNLYKHLKLVSSTPIRNMATLAGNFVNASPIGDMTAWFLALDAEIELTDVSANSIPKVRTISLKDFYLDYKKMDKADDEIITKIRFGKDFTHFNFEKVCKRTYLDIASVNTAISLKVADNKIIHAHISAGGVSPIPLYLRQTSDFLTGREISKSTVLQANDLLQAEISPISDVRGSAEYKKLLAKQLFTAHFFELFDVKF